MIAIGRILFRLVFTAALVLSVSHTWAKPPATDTDTGCLSNLEINTFAKDNLSALQLIDPNVSLGDLKTVINNVGDCVTLEAANLAVEDYATGLNPPVPNTAPSISGTPDTNVAEGATYSFYPTAIDQDGDSLTFSIRNAPLWSVFDSSNGTLTGSPGFDDAGLYSNIVVSVTDGTDSAYLSPFSINVTDTNRPPSISGSPLSIVQESQIYAFTPTASDPDADNLTFSIINGPSWSQFDASKGTLSGTPGFDDAGLYSNIVIKVSDGTDIVSLPTFAIEVLNTNRPPTISGTPESTALIDEPYSFIPSASDPDGDMLNFAIQNMPGWASFDVVTGELFGTPTEAGIHTGIEISVSDGSIDVKLNEITITVDDGTIVGGIANLQWDQPTTREDGTFLSINEIAGYRVYMGSTQDSLEMIVDLNDGATYTHVVTDLTSGTYFFALTTYDIDGLESGFSNVVSIDI